MEITDPRRHADYNWWHANDHKAELSGAHGVALGMQWVSPPKYTEARLATDPAVSRAQYLSSFLLSEPLEETLKAFSEVSSRIRGEDRIITYREVHFTDRFSFVGGRVAPWTGCSLEALPYRPHRGVFLVLVDLVDSKKREAVAQWYDQVHGPDMLTVKGVAGYFGFASEAEAPAQRFMHLFFLDQDPLEMVADLHMKLPRWGAAGRLLEDDKAVKPLLIGPFQSITYFQPYDWFDR